MSFASSGRRAGGYFSALSIVCALLICGCSEQTEPRPRTIPVTGKVTIGGKPLTKGTVTFQPLNSGSQERRRPAISEIDANGVYRIGTFSTGDGALPGDYQVVITSFENDPTAEEYDAGAKRISAIPERYSNAITSGLLAQVPTDATEPITIDFALEE